MSCCKLQDPNWSINCDKLQPLFCCGHRPGSFLVILWNHWSVCRILYFARNVEVPNWYTILKGGLQSPTFIVFWRLTPYRSQSFFLWDTHMLPRVFGVHRKPFNKKEFLQRVRNQQNISNKERENCQARQLGRQRISEDGVFFGRRISGIYPTERMWQWLVAPWPKRITHGCFVCEYDIIKSRVFVSIIIQCIIYPYTSSLEITYAHIFSVCVSISLCITGQPMVGGFSPRNTWNYHSRNANQRETPSWKSTSHKVSGIPSYVGRKWI